MIYSDIAATLADARQQASSLAQLRFLDRLILMLADTLADYHRFNADLFIDKCKRGHDLPPSNTLE